MPDSPSHPLPDAYNIAIGRLIVAVARLDFSLTGLLAAMIDINTFHSLAIIDHQQPSSKLDSAYAIIHHGLGIEPKTKEARDKARADFPILSTLDAAHEVVEFRNQVAHRIWRASDIGEVYGTKFSARRFIRRSRLLYQHQTLLEKADAALAIAESLDQHADLILERRSFETQRGS